MTAKLRIEKLTVPVTVLGTRSAYGRIDYLVSPESGSGEQWVAESRLSDIQFDDPVRCLTCNEPSGAAGSSMYGSVHMYGPRGHKFTGTDLAKEEKS